MKRIFLLVVTNIAVMAVLALAIQVFGLDRYLAQQGMNLAGLLIISAVFGFGGAFISLLISKWMAKRAMGVKVITQPANETERWLVECRHAAGSGGRHRHARSRHFRFAGSERLRHGCEQELRAGGGEHGPAAQHAPRRSRSGAGPRSEPRRQRRHGHAHAHPGRHEHLRVLPRARHRRHRRQGASSRTSAATASAISSRSSSRRSCSASSPAWSSPGSRASVNSARTRAARISRAPTR